MGKKTKYSTLKKMAHEFSRNHFKGSDPEVDLHCVMVEKAEDEYQLALMVGKDNRREALEKLVRQHFGEVPFRIVEQEEGPYGSSGAATSGIGVMRSGAADFGTVGGWFRMQTDRNGNPVDQRLMFGVSNNHVVGECGNGAPGDVLTDVHGNVMGRLFDVSHLDPGGPNDIDMGVFQVEAGLSLSWNPAAPVGWTGAQVGYRVYKQGAKSGYTEGSIVGTGEILANLCGVNYHFTDVLIIKGSQGLFSEEGDSGSIVMTMNHLMAGLLFAKAGEFAYACRIKHLGKMNLTF